MLVLARSPLTAWAAYVMIGALGSLGVGGLLAACDGAAPAEPAGQRMPGAPGSSGATGATDAAPAGARDADVRAGPRTGVYADLGGAFTAILQAQPRVLGVGELHLRTDRGATLVSALARFSAEGLPAIATQTSDLVLETWVVDPACKVGAAATARVESAMRRPASTKSELGALFGLTKASSIKAHVMRLACADLAAVAPERTPDGGPGEVDAERLLDIVTRELARITGSAIRYRDERQEARPLIVVYGGALHNDLYPYQSTARWSFAKEVDRAAGGRYVEVDLFVPELIEGNPLYQREPWYPAAQQAPADKVLLIERAPRSYVVILPRS